MCAYVQVIDETKMLAYHSELKEWERKEEERKHLFTITDKNNTPSKTKIVCTCIAAFILV